MKLIRFAASSFVPAAHEDPLSPGVLKKVLLKRDDLQPGRIQMINWATLAPGRRFAPHYHEDMQEIFIVLEGEVQMTVGTQTLALGRGDAVLVDAHEIHHMENPGPDQVDYLAIGITDRAGGQTVVVDDANP